MPPRRRPAPVPREPIPPAPEAAPAQPPAAAQRGPEWFLAEQRRVLGEITARSDQQEKLLVMFPLADGRVRTFAGKYSGQTMRGPDGVNYKPGQDTVAYFAKQAKKAITKAATARDQPVIRVNTKMVTHNREAPVAMRTDEGMASDRRDEQGDVLRTVGRYTGFGYARRERGEERPFTRYGRQPRTRVQGLADDDADRLHRIGT